MRPSKKILIMWGIFLVLGIILLSMQIFHTSLMLKNYNNKALANNPTSPTP